MKKILYFFPFLFLLFSCSTTIPRWIENKPDVRGKIVYVIKGEGKDKEEAKDDCIKNIISTLENDLGLSLSSSSYRELYSFKALKDPSSTIEGEYFEKDGEKIICYIRLDVDESEFYYLRNPIFYEINSRDSKIEVKLEEAIECYKNNKDMDAVERVLEAILISSEGETSDEFSSENLLSRVIEYLDKLVLGGSSGKNGKVLIKMQRDKGVFKSGVENAFISVKYHQGVIDSDGVEEREYILLTDSDGKAEYKKLNPYSLFTDEIEVLPYINRDLLYRISLVTPKDFLKPLYDKMESKKITIPVEYKAKINSDDVIILYSEHDANGKEREKEYIPSSLLKTFLKLFLSCPRIEKGDGDDEEEVLKNGVEDYPGYKKYIILRSGITSFDTISPYIYARSEGSILVYDKKSGEKKMVDTLYFASSSENKDEAEDGAMEMLSEIIAFRVLEEF